MKMKSSLEALLEEFSKSDATERVKKIFLFVIRFLNTHASLETLDIFQVVHELLNTK